ncbi:DUF3152 domain-containing protein [Streptomyces sp. NPDC052101]|uniref:DUF3152 domain-containing protein n=1 Tax=Streptomyces sp. NPDC052101 TaxID=3155763 RepID=UPI0034433D4E
MGRHSRRGPAPKDDSADIIARRTRQRGPREGDARDISGKGSGPGALYGDGAYGEEAYGQGPYGQRTQGRQGPAGAPGAPGVPGAMSARGGQPLFPGQRQAPMGGAGAAGGAPRGPQAPSAFPDGTPAHGVPRFADGTPAHGVPRLPDGTPARGVPRLPDGTPVHGVPRVHGGAGARGGHPEVREAGGGWGEFAGAAGAGAVLPRQRPAGPGPGPGQGQKPGVGPRQDYLDAFTDAHDGAVGTVGAVGVDDDIDVFAPRTGRPRPGGQHPADAPEADGAAAPPAGLPGQRSGGRSVEPPGAPSAQRPGGKGRAFTGIAAAAVTTVLAVVVAGQVAESRDGGGTQSRSAPDQARDAGGPAPSASPGPVTLSYEQKMDRKYPLGVTLKGSGKFDAVPGFDKAPGKGQKYTYRVDVEQGLGLDGGLFAEAVQKTLNDDRSWAHAGARTFERISSGKPDFVITLASPGTTATWCAKSGLDTTEDNVSCDSAATERVMINAYRWAQGSKTYGDKMYAYRQMLINHEVGHRLGHGHVTCQKNGELAPVMQQQTKFLDHDGIHCLPNPWPYPKS